MNTAIEGREFGGGKLISNVTRIAILLPTFLFTWQ